MNADDLFLDKPPERTPIFVCIKRSSSARRALAVESTPAEGPYKKEKQM